MTTVQAATRRAPWWGLLLIAGGVIWLLAQMNIISGASLAVLFRLWPLLLIGLGLELLVGRSSPALSTLIVIGTIALLIVLMIVGPSLGLAQGAEIKAMQYEEPVGEATTADISLGVAAGNLNVTPLAAESNTLFNADIRYIGDVEYSAEGSETSKSIRLQNESRNNFNITFFDFFNWNGTDDDDLFWQVDLSREVPLDLNVSAGAGNTTLDLTDILLTGLNVSAGAGSIHLRLPNMGDAYEVNLSAGAGSIDVTIPDDAALQMTLRSGAGSAIIDVPEGAAVRIQGDSGVGNVSLPNGFLRVDGDDDNPVGESGVWQTEGFEEAARQIEIEFDSGVGNLTVR